MSFPNYSALDANCLNEVAPRFNPVIYGASRRGLPLTGSTAAFSS